MNLYTKEQTSTIHSQTFAYLEIEEQDHVLTITLDRENRRNALHPQMVVEIAYAMNYAHHSSSVWVVIIQAKGKVFCAGGDLKAMAGIIEPNNSTVPKQTGELLMGEIFNKTYVPTIAKITGDVYAGGFFFLAGCNIVIAQDNVKFGLPEVKRGLYPFQVMEALLRVMPARKVIDWCIRGYNLPVNEAVQYGLVSSVTTADKIDEEVSKVVNELKKNSPTAISKGLEAFDVTQSAAANHQYLHKMLMDTIQSKDGQEGLKAFREKRQPEWKGE